MRKQLFVLTFFLAVLTGANAQPEIKAYGPSPRKGTVIHGVVRNSEGPVRAAEIFEVNKEKEVVVYAYSDKNGHFSLELVDQNDSLFFGGFNFITAKCSISNSQYEITLERIPEDVILNNEMNHLFRKSYRSLIEESKQYPYLHMDGHVIYRDSKAWEGIDSNKENFSKQEIARLFGVDAGQIETIKVYEKGTKETMEWWGSVGERGVIEIQTKGNRPDE